MDCWISIGRLGFGAPEGRKSRLAKAAGAERAAQMRDEKVHAVVARSTFPSQNVQNTPCSDHFWRFRCRKSADPVFHSIVDYLLEAVASMRLGFHFIGVGRGGVSGQ